ncbi:MAG: radical SAM protein [Chloroflexi bacterium]|nr:radical SAM protein [Chloroflexota bacterium]
MLKILLGIPLYKSFRAFGFPKLLPLNITLSVTYRCNSRCRTCGVYNKQAEEFTIDEYEKLFKSLGKSPYWFTMSGGEPFLRNDFADICKKAYDICSPGIINIPTNGLLFERIPVEAEKIASLCPGSDVIINLSLDDIGERHDAIRGIPGNFDKSMKTWSSLKDLRKKYKNLSLGIHTVISRLNVDRIPEIYEDLIKLEPDSYITEIAEERVELDTIGAGITPSVEDYRRAAEFLEEKLHSREQAGVSSITRSFRQRYYNMVPEILSEKKQVLPCYAGFASAHISPDGDVWFCCIKAESVGNLREANYDFGKIWFGKKAAVEREKIKEGACYCPLANAAYTNMLHHVPTLFRVGWSVIKGR